MPIREFILDPPPPNLSTARDLRDPCSMFKTSLFNGITTFYYIWMNNILKKLLVVLLKWIPLYKPLLCAFHCKHNLQLAHDNFTHQKKKKMTNTKLKVTMPTFKIFQKKKIRFLRTVVNIKSLERPMLAPLT